MGSGRKSVDYPDYGEGAKKRVPICEKSSYSLTKNYRKMWVSSEIVRFNETAKERICSKKSKYSSNSTMFSWLKKDGHFE